MPPRRVKAGRQVPGVRELREYTKYGSLYQVRELRYWGVTIPSKREQGVELVS